MSFAQADAARLPLPNQCIDMTFGSPPYCSARLYLENGVNLGIARDAREWVEWMLTVTAEALRVTRGPVLWVCAGVTRDRCYWPACEGLLWEGWKRGWLCECPCYWHRVGIPGSGGDQWFRKDVEYVLCFKASPVFPWSDNKACGEPPKWAPGGAMSNRLSDGARVNQWGGRKTSGACRKVDGTRQAGGRPSHRIKAMIQPDGSKEMQGYSEPIVANPGNLIKTNTGGNHLGHPIAFENKAPFPEALAEHFIRSFCEPGGTCLDPFSGSGTTVSVAERLGRVGIGFDLRKSQCDLGTRRLTRPHAPVAKAQAATKPMPLFKEVPL